MVNMVSNFSREEHIPVVDTVFSDIEKAHQHDLYNKYLDAALKADLTDIATQGIAYKSGVDAQGRVIVVILGHKLPQDEAQLNKLFLYCIRFMDTVADKNYVIVYSHSLVTHTPEFAWLESIYKQLHVKYKNTTKLTLDITTI